MIVMQLPGVRNNNQVQRGVLGYHLQVLTTQATHCQEPQVLSHHPCHHLVLLESDTEVTDDDLCPISLHEMIKDFNSLAADNVDLDLSLDNEAYVWGVRSVCELFDFSSKHWVKEYQKKCSLEEELNFYELLSGHDINAAGVEESEFCDYR